MDGRVAYIFSSSSAGSKTGPDPADPINSAGTAILNAARTLSIQLHDAEKRILELEAEVRRHRNRAETAEKWLLQISEELERHLLGGNTNNPERKNVDELRERFGLLATAYSR
jgi:predicted  nucleic acid-binding Zn-ribbon protein